MRLFLYGTLMAGSSNPIAASLHRKLAPGIPATARGTLHAIPDPEGWYPALIGAADGVVHGTLHDTLSAFEPGDLAVLDAYEGADYVRREIAVVTGEASVAAVAWLWSAALPASAVAVPDGRFATFLIMGHRAFGS